ncbi:unnamed protein product [Adineta ricciae]|uniref:Uncharacterized protein n=1 Tax=Adineta ricciae TaxID=249248 RepID=A0A815NCC5_ADIRI|nr:unnamed protein product [Adineta ricciae]CAF1573866.1 unnamed protein product [Adineta ricciae]
MANFSSFEQQYQSALHDKLSENVNIMQQKVNQAQSMSDADAAERALDEACDGCLNRVANHVKEIKESARQKRASCKTPADEQRYTTFIQGVASGIQATQSLIDTIFTQIRNLVVTVVSWIRMGISWMASTITDVFNSIRAFL